jgi:hypothetical protein
LAALAARALAAVHAQAMPEPDARAPADPRLAPLETGFARVVPPPAIPGPEPLHEPAQSPAQSPAQTPAHESTPQGQGPEANARNHSSAHAARNPSAIPEGTGSPDHAVPSGAVIPKRAPQNADTGGAASAPPNAGNAR